jgi:hypothetical protein
MTIKTKKAAAKKTVAKTVKLTAEQADKIVISKATGNGRSHYVESAGGERLSYPTDRWTGKLRDLSVVGGSFKAAKEEHSKAAVATMARGLTNRAAPQSAKAVADQRASAPKAAPAAKAAPKAAKPAKAKPADDQRKLALTEKGEAKLAKLSAADRKKDRLQLMAGAGTVAKAVALSNVSIGDVNYAVRTGLLSAA